MSQLLAGIRVLELATGVSGPYLGKLFADHGADVIKVESPGGDPARRHGPWGDSATAPQGADSLERSPLFLHLNTNKRSVVADIGSPSPSADDIEFVGSLAAESDIVVEAFPPGHLDSIGLGYEVMCTLRPGIVLTSITPFGQAGPYADAGYRGSDIVTYAMGGPMWGTGIDEREPVKLSGDVTSYQVGNLAAVPTLAALMMSQRHGRPSHIDVSAFEAQAGTIDRRASYLLYEAWTGTDVGRDPRQPQRASPVGFYPTADGWALVFTLPSWAPRMVQTLTDAGLGGEPGGGDSLAERFASPAWLVDPDLPDMVETALYVWLAGHTQSSVGAAAQVNKWGVTPLNAPIDLLDDPHFAARGFFVPVEHPAAGTVHQLGAPFRIHRDAPTGPAEQASAAPRPAPLLGEHDAEVRAALATLARQSNGSPDPEVEPNGEAVAAPATQRSEHEQETTGAAAGALADPRFHAATSQTAGVGRVDADPTSRAPGGLPLTGIRVLDLTVVWAGPACTMYLGDLGAEVIRVDNPYVFPTATRGLMVRPPREIAPELGPLSGYPDHDPGRRPWNRQNLFSAHARGKLSCTLDPRTELGRSTLHRLVRESDVIVENNSLGVLPKLGLDWETVHAVNPRTIVLRMPPMGLEGPYSDWVGFGANFEALCGLTGLRGYDDDNPTSLTSVFHMDPASAATAAFALLAVLRRRDGVARTGGTGVGELIEFSQSENVMQHIGEYFIDAAANGTRHQPLGNRSVARAPQGCYRCAIDTARPDQVDEWAVITCETDEDWLALARLIDGDRPPESAADRATTDRAATTIPPLSQNTRLATLAGRLAHHDHIDERIEAWTSARSSHEVFHRCQQAGVPAGPVMRESQLRTDPQMGDRCWFRQNGSVEQGWYSFPGRQWRWDGPEMPWRPIGILGDANEYVFRQILGLDNAEWQALCDEGHITRDYLNPDGTSM
ncbi:CaiB/BaiF CoA transferase family protein [Candidatus Poriferisodalis sp.]|uniref:CaiB/BaiF CoA transferase family protein n=1 Tax=Candidatus Poriferisodalis sp. TaxID=3101277 RepID=UPI003B51A5AB